MTIKNLITLLEQYPPEMTVKKSDWSENHAEPADIYKEDVFINNRNKSPFVQIGMD